MNKKLIIIIGLSGSGKTSFAKYYARKHNVFYIDFDLIFNHYQPENKDFIKKISDIMNFSEKDTFILDGYTFKPTPLTIEDKLKCKIEFYLCFTAPHIILERQKKKVKENNFPKTMTIEEIEKTNSRLFRLMERFHQESFFVDTTKESFEIMDINNFIARWDDLIFLSNLNNKKNYDSFYQDIELSSGLKIKGYSHSQETWKRISSVIDFFGKNLLDIGSFHGFFSFKAEKSGASKIIGLEKNKEVVKIAEEIALIKNSIVRFIIKDIVEYEPSEVYDIVFVLNMLHHVPDTEKALKNIFKSGKTIVFEIETKQEKEILEKSKIFDFEKVLEMNSHRDDRKILILKNRNNKSLITKNKYLYTPSRYVFGKFIKNTKGLIKKFIPKFILERYRKKKNKINFQS